MKRKILIDLTYGKTLVLDADEFGIQIANFLADSELWHVREYNGTAERAPESDRLTYKIVEDLDLEKMQEANVSELRKSIREQGAAASDLSRSLKKRDEEIAATKRALVNLIGETHTIGDPTARYDTAPTKVRKLKKALREANAKIDAVRDGVISACSHDACGEGQAMKSTD